ncbi:hypothetical protein Tco_0910501 [Tanacetum coccineum]|uniref:MAK10-like protein n=1 Tax=Tanacetum coccineum TaxID=301880 RepID=A0ABQ5CWB4_9ASTR
MEDPKQGFVKYASSHTDEAEGKWYTFKPKQNNLGDTYNPSWRSHPNLRWRQPQNSQNNFSNPPNRFQPNGSILNRSFNNNPRSFNNQSNLEGLVSNFMVSQDARLSKFEANFKQQQSEMTNKSDIELKAIANQIADTLPSATIKNPKLSTYPVLEKKNKEEEDDPKNIHDPSVTFITEKVLKFNSLFESLRLVPPSSNTELICTKEEDGDVMFIEIVPKDDNSHKEEPKAGEQELEYFDLLPTRSELAYHKYLMCGPIPSIFLRNPIIMEGCPSNLKIPCNIGHVHVEKAYIDLNSPLNIMTRMMYNWIMRRKLDPRENVNGGVSNFTGRIKGMHVFVGNFTYIVDFMIIEDISSIIDPRLSQVVLGKPFVEISNMTHDPQEGLVRSVNSKGSPALELSLKRPRDLEDIDMSTHKRSVVRQSDLSAISRSLLTVSQLESIVHIFVAQHHFLRNDGAIVKLLIFVWISQKSQENNQKQASTDTRIRRVQKEAKEAKP